MLPLVLPGLVGGKGRNDVVDACGALVGEPLDVLFEREVFPMSMFSTVKLEIVLFVEPLLAVRDESVEELPGF